MAKETNSCSCLYNKKFFAISKYKKKKFTKKGRK